MAPSVLTKTSRRDWTDDIDAPVRQIDHKPPPQLLPFRMNETLSISQYLPGPGEIFVFRFRSQWQRVSEDDAARGDVVLSVDNAYAGVWIMIGNSANYLGLGTSLPSFKIASEDAVEIHSTLN
jgi:hypothetical protein